jgi:hypothetical protein
MSDGTKMELGFEDLGGGDASKPPKSEVLRVAGETGRAEGYTRRASESPADGPVVPARRINIQLNLKVPVEFRDRFHSAFLADSAQDRSIRSAGEFFIKVFEAWEAGKKRRG